VLADNYTLLFETRNRNIKLISRISRHYSSMQVANLDLDLITIDTALYDNASVFNICWACSCSDIIRAGLIPWGPCTSLWDPSPSLSLSLPLPSLPSSFPLFPSPPLCPSLICPSHSLCLFFPLPSWRALASVKKIF
jgi:hypothetical protein